MILSSLRSNLHECAETQQHTDMMGPLFWWCAGPGMTLQPRSVKAGERTGCDTAAAADSMAPEGAVSSDATLLGGGGGGRCGLWDPGRGFSVWLPDLIKIDSVVHKVDSGDIVDQRFFDYIYSGGAPPRGSVPGPSLQGPAVEHRHKLFCRQDAPSSLQVLSRSASGFDIRLRLHPAARELSTAEHSELLSISRFNVIWVEESNQS